MNKTTKEAIKQIQSAASLPKSSNNTGPERSKMKKDYVLIDRLEGKNYADLLKILKETVNPVDIAEDIKDISATNNSNYS